MSELQIVKVQGRRQYFSSDKIEKNEMGGACSTYGGTGEVHTGFLVGKPEGKGPLGRPRRR